MGESGAAGWRWAVAGILLLATFPVGWLNPEWRALWPSAVALAGVLLTREVLAGLCAGALSGALLLTAGNPLQAFIDLFGVHLLPAFASPWKTGALLFTFMLGGFVAVLEASGGLRRLAEGLARGGGAGAARRFQLGAFGLGLVVFFDGLANSLMVGRLLKGTAARAGVSGVKLAFIVDSTSSPVACLAFISTWIAFQLQMIGEGLAAAGMAGAASPYGLFFASLPLNFYCWFALGMVLLSALRDWNPGPMGAFEARARAAAAAPESGGAEPPPTAVGCRESLWLTAGVPVAALILAILGGLYFGGAPEPFPVTAEKVTAAFGGNHGALTLVVASAFASLVALAVYPWGRGRTNGFEIYLDGMQAMFRPLLILLGAWMLSSVLDSLQAGPFLGRALSGAGFAPELLPLAVFLLSAAVSFATGTSWGTMGIVMPLAIPVAAQLAGPEAALLLVPAIIGAVFSGAVFGDHCSPLSDTTIVSAIACGVSTHDHVRTQMPFALGAAALAALAGFLPAGFGLPAWVGLAAGAGVMAVLSRPPKAARG